MTEEEYKLLFESLPGPEMGGQEVPTGGDEQYGSATARYLQSKKPNMSDSFFTGATNAVSFGLNDELSAANTTLWDKILGTHPGQGWRELYGKNLQVERGGQEAAQEAHPVSSIMGNIGGAASTAVASPVLGGTNLLASAARPAVTSALQAGAQGFGEGEGGFLERLKRGAESSVVGGILGGLFGVAGYGLTKGPKTVQQLTKQKTVDFLTKQTDQLYKAANETGEIIPGPIAQKYVAEAQKEIRAQGYFNPTGNKKDKALNDTLDKIYEDLFVPTTKGEPKLRDFKLDELEQIRKNVWANFKTHKDGRILRMTYAIDDILDDAAENGSAIIKEARDASRIKRNVELFDLLMGKAESATKAGGTSNYAVAYKRAAQKILSGKYAPYLRDTDKAALQSIVDGTVPENVAQFIGKFAPTGGGIGSVVAALTYYHNPVAAVGLAAATHGAKEVANANTLATVANARNILSGSNLPPPAITAGQGPIARGTAVTAGQGAPNILDMILPQQQQPNIGGIPYLNPGDIPQ